MPARYTAAEVKALTEAALRLGRIEALEEVGATQSDTEVWVYNVQAIDQVLPEFNPDLNMLAGMYPDAIYFYAWLVTPAPADKAVHCEHCGIVHTTLSPCSPPVERSHGAGAAAAREALHEALGKTTGGNR